MILRNKKSQIYNSTLFCVIIGVIVLILIGAFIGNLHKENKKVVENFRNINEWERLYNENKKFEKESKIEKEDLVSEEVDEVIENFAENNKIELSKLYAIIKVESFGNFFYKNKHPIVRFECVKYNKDVENKKKVSCDISKNRYGSLKDTNYEAFKIALKKNREVTLLSTSYGFAQILGENYEIVNFSSVSEMYEHMFTKKGQIDAFFNFIKNKNNGIILNELKEESTNWRIVAKNYNGANYEYNNYHTRLETANKDFGGLA